MSILRILETTRLMKVRLLNDEYVEDEYAALSMIMKIE